MSRTSRTNTGIALATAVTIAVVTALATPPAHATSMETGNDFLALYRDYKEPRPSERQLQDIMYLLGFTAAVLDMNALMARQGDTRTAACIPEAVTVGQVIEITARSVTTRPEMAHVPATLHMQGALRRAFPCK